MNATLAARVARLEAQRDIERLIADLGHAFDSGPSASALRGLFTPDATFEIDRYGTLRGADASADEYKYLPVRRLALFLEESLYRGTQWAVFEPNDEPLWAQVRLSIGAFMQGLFRQGAFQGASARDAYFVKCDSQTTTQADINLGVLNVVVGFAPLKPAEFVVIKIQQMAGQIQT